MTEPLYKPFQWRIDEDEDWSVGQKIVYIGPEDGDPTGVCMADNVTDGFNSYEDAQRFADAKNARGREMTDAD